MSSLAKRRIPCASACVFETIHCVRDDKMKAYFYFETASFKGGCPKLSAYENLEYEDCHINIAITH